jgi:ATP-dependent DNA helicase RecG
VAQQDQPVTAPTAQGAATEQVTVQVAPEVTEQVQALVQLSPIQWLIVEHTDTPRTLSELLSISGYKQRPHFKAQHLEPLLAGGVIRMTVPDKPTSSKQQYVLTDTGVKLKTLRMQGKPATEQEPEQ